MAKAQKNSNVSGAQIAVGVGAALLAAAAGTYFLYGKDAPKRRKAVRSWMLKAKGEVLEQIEKLPDLDQATYYGLIDAAAARYTSMKDVNSEEVADLVKELRSYWKGLKKQFTPAKAKKAVKKAAKKVAKKVSKKAVKKSSKKTAKKKSR